MSPALVPFDSGGVAFASGTGMGTGGEALSFEGGVGASRDGREALGSLTGTETLPSAPDSDDGWAGCGLELEEGAGGSETGEVPEEPKPVAGSPRLGVPLVRRRVSSSPASF